MIGSIHYFEEGHGETSDSVFALLKETARTTGVRKILMASTTGAVATRALEVFEGSGLDLVFVPHQFDFSVRNGNRFPADLVARIEAEGHRVHFGTMLFHTDKLYGTAAPTTIATFLRAFGEGVKVCVEISLMAADAGLLSLEEEVLVAAGTRTGLDTALLISPGSTQDPSRLKIHEILCKPLLRRGCARPVAMAEATR